MKAPPPAATKAVKPTFLQRYLGVGLSLLAVAIAGFAGVRWASLLGTGPQAHATLSDMRAWELLNRSMQANNEIPFTAHVQTVAFVGARGLQSEAQMARAPNHLAINYLSGPMKGQQGGFSEQWFWRQSATGHLVPYAQVSIEPEHTIRRRFELMRANYQAHLQQPSEISGRPVAVIELRPLRPLVGARGPARRIFVDDATGVMLRTEAFNSRLQPVSHSTFSKLDFACKTTSPIFRPPKAILAAARQSFWQGEELGDDARAVELKSGIEPPQSSQVPRGWERDGFGVHRTIAPDKTMQVAAFTRYTDGLNVLTLFALKKNSPLSGSRTSESYHCSFGPGTLISRADGAGTLLAVGDLPPEVLREVLDNARFIQVAPEFLS